MQNTRTQTYHAMQLLLAERDRQIEAEGWTQQHDDAHGNGEMAQAAGVYALFAAFGPRAMLSNLVKLWPWSIQWLKPGWPVDETRCLVKAGALILAELERRERAGL